MEFFKQRQAAVTAQSIIIGGWGQLYLDVLPRVDYAKRLEISSRGNMRDN
jgi:hypothetical protein